MASNKKKSGLESLKEKAAMVGLDFDQIKNELVNEVISKLPRPVDEKALAEKISATVEARVAIKLSEVLEAVKANTEGNKPNTESITKGVASLLQPQIVEAAKQASEVVFEARSQVLLNQLQEKLQQAKPDAGTEQPVSNMSAGGLIQALLANSEGIAKLIQAFRPQPQPTVVLADEISKLYRFNRIFDDMKKADVDADTFDKKIHEGFAKKSQQ